MKKKIIKKNKSPTVIQKSPYYGLDHRMVNEKFAGDLTFVNEFQLKAYGPVVALYHAAKPNRSEGHKDYMYIARISSDQMVVGGLTAKELEEVRYQDAVHCLRCNNIVWSRHGHDYCRCKCGGVFADGGKNYTRIGFRDRDTIKMVELDLVTLDVKKNGVDMAKDIAKTVKKRAVKTRGNKG